MKRFFRIVWILFGSAMILRFSEMPGTALLLIVSVFLMLVFAIVFSLKSGRDKHPEKFFHFTLFLWSAYLLFRIQFWTYSWHVFGFAVLVTITWVILTLVEVKQFRTPQIALTMYVALNVFLFFVPAHHIYYLYNLNTAFYGDSRNENYYAWDRYSWFLYLDHRYDEALIANENSRLALEKVEHFMEINGYHDMDEFIANYKAELEVHREMITNQAWTLDNTPTLPR